MKTDRTGFTLVELLAAIAIIAALLVTAGVFIANYVATAQREADHQTLTVLNDAITRYKIQGGGTSGFTAGAPVAHVLGRLQQPINWNGLDHQVMKAGVTYAAASISATGTGSAYKFYRYNTYNENGSAGGQGGGAPMAHGAGVGYFEVVGSDRMLLNATSSTGYWAIKVDNLAPVIVASAQWSVDTYMTGTTATFWACAGAADATPSGNITAIDANYGGYTIDYMPSLSSLDVTGLTALTSLECSINEITTLNLVNNTALQMLNCSMNLISSLNVAGLTNLTYLNCTTNQLTSLDLTGVSSLQHFYCDTNQITALDISACTGLQYFGCVNNSITTIAWPNAPGLLAAWVYGNSALLTNSSDLDTLYTTLPDLSGGATNEIYIGSGAPSATDSIASNKGWTINRSE